jgi:predicted small lipoprotein YifL
METMKRAITAAAVLLVTGLAACGSKGSTSTPDACLTPVGGWLKALQAAPDQVLLDGQAPISDCFTGAEDPGIGQTAIKAATVLNQQARRDPGGAATVELGYLDGAIHEGTTHVPSEADLVRRVESAARYNPGGGSPGAAFERAFGKGYAAGEATG